MPDLGPLLCVVGARPNFMKMAPLLRAFGTRKDLPKAVLVYTGQHYDFALNDRLFIDLELPTPDVNLEVGSGSHASQTADVWLKGTGGNDWIYYSAGDYKDIYDYFGEYYFPCLSYPSNAIIGNNPFGGDAVNAAMKSWQWLRVKINELTPGMKPRSLKDFLTRIVKTDEEALRLRSDQLHDLIGGQVTVLPPDTRHVDYVVIPVIVADGCLYNCGFCRVKTGQDFVPRAPKEVIEQIKNLKPFYGNDLHNYNAIFLGQHDALSAGQELPVAADLTGNARRLQALWEAADRFHARAHFRGERIDVDAGIGGRLTQP